MRTLLFLLLAIIGIKASSQDIQYNLVDRENERNQVRKDKFNIHLRTTIEDDLEWFQAIEPNWTNVAGTIKSGEMNILFKDSINDGLLRHSYVYKANGENHAYVIVSVRSFDDGPSEMLFFYCSDKESYFLGDLCLFLQHKNGDFLKDYSEIYAKDEMEIRSINGKFKLFFKEGYTYIYRHNYKEQTMSGPLNFKLSNNEFELVNK